MYAMLHCRRAALGDRHADTIASMINLASVLSEQDELERAQALFEEASRGYQHGAHERPRDAPAHEEEEQPPGSSATSSPARSVNSSPTRSVTASPGPVAVSP